MDSEAILVVDDDTDILDLYALTLRDAGFSVTTATSGTEALSIIQQQKPAIVLHDLMMPELSGEDVCRAIKADPALHDIIFVIVSARTDLESRLNCLHVGAEEYLTKPIDLQELVLRVRRLADLKSRFRETTPATLSQSDESASGSSDREYKTLPTVLGLTPTPSDLLTTPAPEGEPSTRKEKEKYGSYRIENLTGAGGMGLVFKAYDEALDRYVAVKVLSKEFSGSQEFLQRFQREARVIASINHPGIAQIYTFGQEEDESFFALQWCSGGSLAQLIRRLGKIELLPAVDILLQCARALEAATLKGVVHRDIKPSNLMFDDEQQIKIVDFGVASSLKAPEAGTTNYVIGSPAYMAPEQGRGETADHRADIYSLGITFYQMLYGHPPFLAKEPLEWIAKHRNEPFPAYDSQSGKVPPAAYNIIRKMTEKEPGDRYQKYSLFIKDLERLRTALYSEKRLKIPKAINVARATTFKSDSFSHLLSYAYQNDASGLFRVSWGPLHKKFLVKNKEIIFFESPIPDENIWKALIGKKLMQKSDSPPPEQDLEEALNRLFFIQAFSPEDFKSVYRDTMYDSILQVFWWPMFEGEFYQARIEHEPLARIPLARVIMEGARNAIPLEKVQQMVSENQWLARTPKFEEILITLNLQRSESFIASRLEGDNVTIKTLEFLTGFSPELIARTVCGLEKLGALVYRSPEKKRARKAKVPPKVEEQSVPVEVAAPADATSPPNDVPVKKDRQRQPRVFQPKASPDAKTAEMHYENARKKYEEAEYWEAQIQCAQAIRSNPTEPRYHHLMALSLVHLPHSVKVAEESFREAIRLDPQNPEYRYDLASFFKACGRLNDALGECFLLLEISPSHPKVRELLEDIEI